MEETCLPKSRKFTSVNIEKFKINIKNKNMLTVHESNDCQETFSKFNHNKDWLLHAYAMANSSPKEFYEN